MIALLVSILVALLILGLIFYLISLIPLPPPFALAARVVFIVICILVVLYIASPWFGNAALR
ncbi:hypothetical protein FVF58_01095 [Paraburkholderia panacisoli]|uniref:Uncharacterized protein n=1 Tax=Paraburkholderia panacisoli TaxID=2603818 RepID=A0A5B0HL44_9BURK|nr:hypothetical protein [Paraburkholderia panacisoli]KAA1015978.1 hypothetical protein FVF58_01095 [Paraburkholderia panacisoli]